MTFVVGQTVYVERNHRRPGGPPEPTPVKVAKVGRKWVTLDDNTHHPGRFELGETQPFELDGGDYMSPGRVWLTLMDWEIHTRRTAAWRRIQAAAKASRPPSGVTLSDLDQMAGKLEGGR